MDTRTREMVETGEEMATETMAQAKEKFQQGKEAVRKYAEQAKEYAGKAKDATQSKIEENPFQAMLIALGVGACIGVTLGLLFGGSRDE